MPVKKLFGAIDKILTWIAGISISGFTLLVFAQVVARYIFKSPLHWQEEVCLYLLFAVVFSGSVLAINRGAHISVDFISNKIGPEKKLLVAGIVNLFILLFSIFFAYSGYQYCTSVGNRRSGELRIMMKYIYAMFPVTGVLMSLSSLYNSLIGFIGYFKKGDRDKC